ncbi:MAG: hypothetical protein AB1611_21265 [bacterium]
MKRAMPISRTMTLLAMTLRWCLISAILLYPHAVAFALSVAAPANPVNDRGIAWEKKVMSTASGMIHIQWREEAVEPPDSYRIYRGEGTQNPFSTAGKVLAATPWQSDLPAQYCFFRYLPEDEDEGKRFWFLVRAVKNGDESGNLDAESVVVDLPWINGRSDPNFISFYVEDDERSDSFLQESQKCPFCSESNKTYYRLARADVALKRDYAWYYVDRDWDRPPDLEAIADCFENEIYPANLACFGRDEKSELSDIDGNGHLIILLTELGGAVDGYFNAEDKILDFQYQNRVSNCADMLYVSSGSPLLSIKATLAHEFQHMQHLEANVRRGAEWEELWLDEACSGFAEEINNLYSLGIYFFQMLPNEISLTRFGYADVHDRFGGCPIHWNNGQRQNRNALYRVIAHYEQVSLFAHYMEYNCSPVTPLASLVEDPNQGLVSVQNHIGLDFRQAFINWTIANYLNPYASSQDIRYHYTAQFPGGKELIETQSVIPTAMLLADWIRSPQQEPAWTVRSLRDLSADYVLLRSNSLPDDRVHWEIRNINAKENVCHLAILDKTDPADIQVHEVAGIPLSSPLNDAASGAGTFSFAEDSRTILESCLIVTNLARYQDSNYASSYECRAYRTRKPRVLQVRLVQDRQEWTLDGPAAAGTLAAQAAAARGMANAAASLIRAGQVQVIIQFDQSMSGIREAETSGGLVSCLLPGGTDAGSKPAVVQPAAPNPWSKTVYPDDTWTGMLMVPQGLSRQWDGLARLVISGGKNFWQELMDKDERFSFFIDTQAPQPVASQITCFISSTVEISWSRNVEPDIAGYRLYGTSPDTAPVWIPQEGFGDPNRPSYLWSNAGPGVYTLTLTAVDQAGNESLPSNPASVGIGVEVSLDAGLNLISYPVEPPSGYTSDLWLTEQGSAARSLHQYQPTTLVYETTCRREGEIGGSIFPIIQDSGYLIYRQEAGKLMLSGPIQNHPVSLCTGRNMAGIPLLSGNESSRDFFHDLIIRGEPVSSIHVYQPSKGRWESCYGFFGQMSGNSAKIKKGQGCLVDLRGKRSGQ